MIYLFTLILTAILFIIDKEKTIKGLKIGLKKIRKNSPVFLNLIILVAISLYFISDDLILRYLGEGSGLVGIGLASLFGSIAFMPGFVAFPLAGILLSKGVNYMVVAAFITTLMLVGVATYPVEKEYFGIKATIWRNIAGFIISAMIAVATGVLYGEVLI